MELEEQFVNLKKEKVKRVVMIQCVGSRNEEHPYCNRICCSETIKNSLKMKDIDPEIDIFVLYRDIRTYGFNEKYYAKARDLGVNFIRFEKDDPPNVEIVNGKIKVSIYDSSLRKTLIINPDKLVLSVGVVQEHNSELSKMLKVPLNKYGFYLEAHPKLRPLDFATDGVFLCGTAHWPKFIDESIAQAIGAAARAGTVLSKKEIEIEGNISFIDPEICIGCGYCNDVCPYNAIKLITTTEVLEELTVEVRKSEINPALCKGCGKCVPRCPVQAITQKHFTNEQITDMEEALLL
jgi:heterodisulfide reductase subunit A